ncbi:uncharacterized protein LOC124848430 [Vigna umbellata]|uniref:uncharacterized protein LOC124848430 n=1 Tax=Vigna umbellata TaxID=87088 RepID=UPI001F5FBBBC|nr:uncharacterized protein LOC124848430 [Vigna umbellata]
MAVARFSMEVSRRSRCQGLQIQPSISVLEQFFFLALGEYRVLRTLSVSILVPRRSICEFFAFQATGETFLWVEAVSCKEVSRRSRCQGLQIQPSISVLEQFSFLALGEYRVLRTLSVSILVPRRSICEFFAFQATGETFLWVEAVSCFVETKQILAMDISREYYELGLPVIEKAGVAHKIDFREGPALPLLDQLIKDENNKGSFDFIFVDADKDNYLNYHNRVIELVKIGGMIAYDNTLWNGSVAAPSDAPLLDYIKYYRDFVIELNQALALDSRVEICQLPVGDGITLCRRII